MALARCSTVIAPTLLSTSIGGWSLGRSASAATTASPGSSRRIRLLIANSGCLHIVICLDPRESEAAQISGPSNSARSGIGSLAGSFPTHRSLLETDTRDGKTICLDRTVR